MVKVLFSGTVAEDQWETFFQRVKEVQYSAHGPFDVLFLTGKAFNSLEQFTAVQEQLFALAPMTIYSFQHAADVNFSEMDTKNVRFVGPSKVGLINADKNLTIAYAVDLNDSTYQRSLDSIRKIVSTGGYRGCDALITSAWPREAHSFLEGQDFEEFKATSIGIGSGARWAAEMALLVRPRYHFVANLGQFYQRPPYKNTSTLAGQPMLFSRLITLNTTTPLKEKHLKWLHALSLQPIIYLKQAEVEEAPATFTICPYAPVGGGSLSAADAEPPAKKARADLHATAAPKLAQPGLFFFGGAGRGEINTVPPNAQARTLFIGGLGRDMSDHDLMSVFPDAVGIRRQSGKGFAFLDFPSHEAAQKVVKQSTLYGGMNCRGRQLSVGWASNQEKKDGGAASGSDETLFATLMKERVLVPPSENAQTLYVGNLPGGASVNAEQLRLELQTLFPKAKGIQLVPNKYFAFMDFPSYLEAVEALQFSLTQQLVVMNRPVVVGWSKQAGSSRSSQLLTTPPHPDCRVLYLGNLGASVQEDEIRGIWKKTGIVNCIRRPQGREYAFVEFHSSEDAQEAMEAVANEEVVLQGQHVTFGWAQGKPAAQQNESKECWFCLASPMLKAHLVISVGSHVYLAMPRGAVNEQHVLICPIDCVPSRLHLSLDAKKELHRFVDSLSRLFATLNSSLVLFERAIRTKSGRDHMQIQCIPIPNSKKDSLQEIFNQKASQASLRFHELASSQAVDDAVLSMEGGPYQEYFYMELPSQSDQKKFVYVQEEGSTTFPMQFGTEVVTAALGCPERVHWKHCLVSEAQEEQLAATFRNNFAPFDFTQS